LNPQDCWKNTQDGWVTHVSVRVDVYDMIARILGGLQEGSPLVLRLFEVGPSSCIGGRADCCRGSHVRNMRLRQVANYSRFSAVARFRVHSSLIGPAIFGGILGWRAPTHSLISHRGERSNLPLDPSARHPLGWRDDLPAGAAAFR
jgi:hypothetical protein